MNDYLCKWFYFIMIVYKLCCIFIKKQVIGRHAKIDVIKIAWALDTRSGKLISYNLHIKLLVVPVMNWQAGHFYKLGKVGA